MPDFIKIHAATMGCEGGYANNPDDAGGETYKGIARKMHPIWPGWKIIDDIKSLSIAQPRFGSPEYRSWVKFLNSNLAALNGLQADVVSFYKLTFWDANHLGEITTEAIAAWIYDHVVNAGARGIMWAQLAAKVKPDGDMGSKSIAAINAANPADLLGRMEDIAGEYRLDRAHNKPSQIQFLTSWLRRDGQPESIIAMVRQAAADGKLDDGEVAKIKAVMEATA